MARVRGVKFTGPFFQGDPRKKFAANVVSFMATVAAAGEADVRARTANTPRYSRQQSPYHEPVQRYVRGRIRSVAGKPWRAYAVISTNTEGMGRTRAISIKAAASVIEQRSHPFRNAKNAVKRAADRSAKDLLRGLT